MANIKHHKVYILYKVKRDELQRVKDILYLKEYTTIRDISKDNNISSRDIAYMINNRYNNNIKTHKDYTIILDYI